MSKTNKLFNDKIEEINDTFDKAHYLEKGRRSIESIYKMLRFKSIKYKEMIEVVQRELTRSLKFKPRYSHGHLVACTIAARCKKNYSFGTSHKLLSKYNGKILPHLKQLGGPGSESKLPNTKNRVGKCAEIKCANLLLEIDQKNQIHDIEFTNAIRPRTLERIPRCPNCVYIFGKEL